MLTYHLGLPSNPVNPNGSLSKNANIRHQPVLCKHPTGYLYFIHISILSHPLPTDLYQTIKDLICSGPRPGILFIKAYTYRSGRRMSLPLPSTPTDGTLTALRKETGKRPHYTSNTTSLFYIWHRPCSTLSATVRADCNIRAHRPPSHLS